MDEVEELHDWEMLETDFIDPSPSTVLYSDNIIQSDYFERPSAESVGPEDADQGPILEEVRAETSENKEDVEEEKSDILLEAKGDISEMESLDGETVVTGDIEQTAVEERSGGVIQDGGGGEDEGRGVTVWWKVPVEILKFCVFRVSPVWTFSIAAAVMGLILLKRRLSKMSRKSRSIPIKLTVEDKRASQMRAARVNEAFSVVRHIPIVRPLLPSSGVTPWPMLNMR